MPSQWSLGPCFSPAVASGVDQMPYEFWGTQWWGHLGLCVQNLIQEGKMGSIFFFPQDDEFGVPEKCQHTDWGVTEIVYVNRHPIKIFVPTHPRGMALIIS